MGVYIPKMEMPKSCKCCRFEYDDMYCLVCERPTMFNKRRDDCPLIAVKEPHGRLIDADVVLSNIGAFADHPNETLVNDLAIAFDIVLDAPTVIEREGE